MPHVSRAVPSHACAGWCAGRSIPGQCDCCHMPSNRQDTVSGKFAQQPLPPAGFGAWVRQAWWFDFRNQPPMQFAFPSLNCAEATPVI